MNNYQLFLDQKAQIGGMSGFDPVWMPDFLFDFQRHLVEWSVRKGRSAIFADCGLGKTPMQLVWAENVRRHTNKPVLILTPLAVAAQTVREAEKFGIDCQQSRDGSVKPNITVTNYEKLHLFNPTDFAGCVCDESAILKNFKGATKNAITEMMRRMQYRLLCTATPSPNDYIELGTSSECLGELGYMDMLGMFFKNDQGSLHPQHRSGPHSFDGARTWRFKSHAERPFWRWLCSWARAIRKPSDLGFSDKKFVLPPLNANIHIVKASRPMDGFLFPIPANGLHEQRQERRHTIKERCEKASELVDHKRPAIIWCHLNPEGDLLDKLIPDADQVSGRDSDEEKEEKFNAFCSGQLRVLIIKPKIGALGLNFQHCSHMTFFPSHSFEQYYQGVRRCWRFGQKSPVSIDIITSEGESNVMSNLFRKEEQASRMFEVIVGEMANELKIKRGTSFPKQEEIPSWL